MTADTLQHLSAPEAARLAPLLHSLWHAAQGHWDEAHGLAQDVDTRDGAWVHAYLHRVEGDPANAGYWYRRAGRPASAGSLEDEWRFIADALLTSA